MILSSASSPRPVKNASGFSIAANRPGSHRAQCLRAISPYWFTVVGSLLLAEPRQHVLHQAGRDWPVPLPDRTGPPSTGAAGQAGPVAAG